jgi:uncharacterized protein
VSQSLRATGPGMGQVTSETTGRATGRATSRDGRTFTFSHADGDPPLPGDVVVLCARDGARFLGQVLAHAAARDHGSEVEGTGVLIGALGPDGRPDRAVHRPFASGTIAPASPSHLEALQSSSNAHLTVGTWHTGGVRVAARLRAQGFGRHTFLCGQSGSGKTYALGVLLERLLLGTSLRMVVLDPNGDFVRLGELRADAPAEAARHWGLMDIRVLGARSTTAEPLRMRFATLPPHAQAAVLRLDPLLDRGEYNRFLGLTDEVGQQELSEIVHHLQEGEAEERLLAQRVENLGMLDWEVWAGALPSAAEVVDSGARLTVLDLSGFRHPQEPLAVSLDLVERLWAHRERRIPTLIVVDEAHNVCAAEPAGAIQVALAERFVQIAAEGRKYGLWLLLSTQRPSKINAQVLSQCDNVALMRMNSPGDVAELAEVFGFAPPALLGSSQFFLQGESLLAGAFVPVPSLVRMGTRWSLEGGRDVPVPEPSTTHAGRTP